MKSDSELRHDVERALEWDPSIDAPEIGVSARDGVVTLAGQTPTFSQKWHAENLAKRVAGVAGIANEIEVKPITERNDTDIAEAAASAIRMDSRLPKDQVKVVVQHGWVILEGNVPFHYQKSAAEDDVRHLRGVKGLTNSIMIAPTASISEVRRKIEDVFKRSALIDADRVSVEVEDGKVILSGTVRTWAERNEAEDAAWAAPGVSDVQDHLIIGV